jgi:hypothetical protein
MKNIVNDQNEYKSIISVGMRCFTEIFLKKLGYKQFSCPFDAIYSISIESIIDILKNKLDDNDLLFTENINDETIQKLNNKHGFRTIHTKFNYDETNLELSYHNALLPHHNLNKQETKEHFDRCFTRLDKMNNNKIKTLFCLFIHPDYGSDPDVSFKDINILKDYLVQHFNCDLLICKFKKTIHNYEWKIIHNENNLMYIHINNSSHIFEHNEKVLNEIFQYLKIDKSKLLTYDEMENIIH